MLDLDKVETLSADVRENTDVVLATLDCARRMPRALSSDVSELFLLPNVFSSFDSPLCSNTGISGNVTKNVTGWLTH